MIFRCFQSKFGVMFIFDVWYHHSRGTKIQALPNFLMVDYGRTIDYRQVRCITSTDQFD